MGQRSNVFIQGEKVSGYWQGIGIYAHDDGARLQEVALEQAGVCLARIGDPEYFTRRLVQLVLTTLNPEAGELGHGLWTTGPSDNERPVLVINAMTGEYWYCDETAVHLDADGNAVRLLTNPSSVG